MQLKLMTAEFPFYAGTRSFFLNNCFVLLPQVWQLGSNTPNFTLEGHEKVV